MAHDLFVKKNKIVDKTNHFQQLMEDIAPDSFVMEPGGESWEKKRKACSHAFYKERLENMMDIFKGKLNTWIDKINTEIDANPNG